MLSFILRRLGLSVISLFLISLISFFIVVLLGPSLMNIVIVIGLVSWTGTARLVRGEFLTLRETAYVQAAFTLGQHAFTIIVRHPCLHQQLHF